MGRAGIVVVLAAMLMAGCHGGAGGMNPQDIVIFASGYQEGSPPPLPAGPPLPYRLSEYRRDAGWEGQPAVNVPQYVLAASRGNHLLDVRVFFGTQAPSDRELARAQAELGTLSWG